MFFVTLVQFFPPSRVICTYPSLVPAQITPASLGDSAIANTVPVDQMMLLSTGSGVAKPLSLPATGCHTLREICAPPKPPNCRLLLGPRYEGPSCLFP